MYDVVVIGGGNAALCAAITACEEGASVLLLETAPKEWRGGNSQHTRNLRCMPNQSQDVLIDAYPEEEYWQDLLKVTTGKTNEHLARLVIRSTEYRFRFIQSRDMPPLRSILQICLSEKSSPSFKEVFNVLDSISMVEYFEILF